MVSVMCGYILYALISLVMLVWGRFGAAVAPEVVLRTDVVPGPVCTRLGGEKSEDTHENKLDYTTD